MTYTLFAGVNGSGKSTLYSTGAIVDVGERINIDDMARELNEQYTVFPKRAGISALHKIDVCINAKISFNQETTLSGRSALRTIRRAKDAGFKVIMYYTYLNSPELAIQRIAARVRKGGHFIEDEIVRRRFQSSLENLRQAISLCDEIYIFDNSTDAQLGAGYRFLCFIRNGRLREKVNDMPKPLLDYLGFA